MAARRRIEAMSCPAVRCLGQLYRETGGGPSVQVAGGVQGRPISLASRRLHPTTTAPAISATVLGPRPVVLRRNGRVWRLSLAGGPVGAPREGQHDEEHGKRSDAPHSITSSARARIDGGTVRPSCLAVLRFTTSSNAVGCCTGRSAGFAPLRIFPA